MWQKSLLTYLGITSFTDLERHEMSAEKCSAEYLWHGRTSTIHASGSSQAVLVIRLLPASRRASPCVPHVSLCGTSVMRKNADTHDSSHWLPVLTIRPLCMHCSIPLCVSLHGFTSFVTLDASETWVKLSKTRVNGVWLAYTQAYFTQSSKVAYLYSLYFT